MLKFVALLHVPTVGVIIARGPAINLPQSEQEGSLTVSCGRKPACPGPRTPGMSALRVGEDAGATEGSAFSH